MPFYVTKNIITKFVAFVVNSVIYNFCPVLLIHLFTPIEGPMTNHPKLI